jgi:transcriptional regulator with XRE-family HTH domain
MAIQGMSRGRQLLLAVLRVTTEADVAARCRVCHPVVSEWTSGLKRPSRASRERLESAYGIPCGSWDISFVSVSRNAERRRKLT